LQFSFTALSLLPSAIALIPIVKLSLTRNEEIGRNREKNKDLKEK
jgi:hypothetical protein